MKRIWCILSILVCFTLTAKSQLTDSIESIIKRDTSLVLREVFSHPEQYKLKIVLTQITTDKKGQKHQTTWGFRDTVKEYIYPASIAKIPLALSTIQFINEHSNFSKELSDILIDSSSYIKERTIYDDIMLMLSASDNAAFNRLYNLVGPKYLNISLLKKGYLNTYLIHRFERGDADYHQSALPIKTFTKEGKLIFEHPKNSMYCLIKHAMSDSLVGTGYYQGDSLIQQPKSFRFHNFVDIRDVHDMMLSIRYPNLSMHKPFNISKQQREILIKDLSMGPLHPNTKEYSDTSVFYPNALRFILFGADKKVEYPNILYFNKSAMAYGSLGDCIYLYDKEHEVEFFLSIFMYVNNDGILNDDKYDYDTIGLPFMKRLGEIIYQKLKSNKTIVQ